MDYYTLVNVRYRWDRWEKEYSKLTNPKEPITCEVCGQKFCQKLTKNKKKRVIKKENIRREKINESDGAYRMVFTRDSRSHNRTDINDRDLNNIYGDARNVRRSTANEEEEKVPNQSNGPNIPRRPPMPHRNPFMSSPEGAYQFSNAGTRGPPSRGTDSRQSNRSNTFQSRASAAGQRSAGMGL